MRRHAELDARLVEAAKPIKILGHLNWPARVHDEFLSGWRAGRPALPRVDHPRLDFGAAIRELRGIAAACDRGHPAGAYVARTADSYVAAARLLESLGTPAFTGISEEIYGRPRDGFGSSGLTNLEAAEHFIRVTEDLLPHCSRTDEQASIPAEQAAADLRRLSAPFFGGEPFEIAVDPDLASRAAAGARRLRLRGHTAFHPSDIPQLLEHEVRVHAATMRNGLDQPHLKSLGLGAPRTTAAQEGLATFAELITATMDLGRLHRIALRVEAIDRALRGADFIDLVRFHLEAGQSLDDAYQSARRVFRGGDPRGRIAFTRDVIYVRGLALTHAFLRSAIQAGRLDYPFWLFAGRLDWGDVLALDPLFRSGDIIPPKRLPDWAAHPPTLAAYLTWSAFASRIPPQDARLEHFLEGRP